MKKRLLNLLLASSLLITSVPANIYAQETEYSEIVEETVTYNSDEVNNGESEAVLDDDLDLSDETIVQETVVDPVDDDTETDDVVSEDYASKGLSSEILGLGYHGIRLNSAQLSDKKELLSIAESLDELEADTDYAGDRITYMADSEEEALNIADCYNARLVFYDYGIASAVVDFEEERAIASLSENDDEIPTDVQELIELAGDSGNNMPAIYPEIIHELEEDTIEIDGLDDIISENYAAGDRGYITNDPYSSAQYYHDYLKDYKAWNAGFTGKGITVAVVDSGVNQKHEDLQGQLTSFRYNSIAADKIYSIYYGYKSSKDPEDDNGHGTHCSGIIAAAKDNGKGGAGVAPDAKIMPIKVMDAEGNGMSSWVAAGIIAAVDKKADIISLSLGGNTEDPLERRACEKAVESGVVVVASAGNETSTELAYPAGTENVISVAALATSDDYSAVEGNPPSASIKNNSNIEKACNADKTSVWSAVSVLNSFDTSKALLPSYFTNYFDSVDVAACGSGIFSTYIGSSSGYRVASGTSQACPQVSGTVALILSANKDIKNLSGKKVSNKINEILRENGVQPGSVGYINNVNYTDIPVNDSGNVTSANIILNCPYIDAWKTVTAVAGIVEAPVINSDKLVLNGDNTYKSGDDCRLIISSDVHIKYTDNGKDPVKFGIEYPMDGIVLDFTGKKTYKAVAYNDFGKYSAVVSFTGTFNAAITSMQLNNKLSVIPGKSAQLTVDYAPLYAKYKKFEYSSDDTNVFTVNAKGVVKANVKAEAGQSAVITVSEPVSGIVREITAVVSADSIKDKGITIPGIDLRKGHTMSVTDTTLFPGDEEKEATYYNKLDMYSLLSTDNDFDLLTITSAKPAVVSYDKNSHILKANKSGKSKITIKANDGSNVSVAFNVTVISPVINMSLQTDTGFSTSETASASMRNVDGEALIGNKGCKVKLTPVFNVDTAEAPEKAKLKLKYESVDSDIVKVSAAGVVTPGRNAKSGDVAVVTAKTTDGSNLTATYRFTVVTPIKDMKLTYIYTTCGWKRFGRFLYPWYTQHTARINSLKDTVYGDIYNTCEYSKYNNINTNLQSNFLEYKDYNDSRISVNYMCTGSGEVQITENENLGYNFKFSKSGKYKIEFVPTDGSAKKITFNFTVIK